MSFWDRLGAAGEEVANIATGGGFGLAWDIAKNSDDEDQAREQGQSFFRRVLSAVPEAADQYLKYTGYGAASRALGHTPSLADLSVPYGYVARGASTFQQATGISLTEPGALGLATANWGSIADMDSWRQAWTRSEEISPGQAAILTDARYRGGIGLGEEDREAREDFFHNSWPGQVMSGSLDLAANLTLDPLGAAGKAFKVANAARSTVKATDRAAALNVAVGAELTEPVSRSAQRSGNKIRSFLDMTDGMTASQMLQLPQFREVDNASDLAVMLEEANRIQDPVARRLAKADYFGVALGDANAIRRVSEDVTSATKIKRLLETPELSEATSKYIIGTGGKDEFNHLNTPANLAEVEGYGEVLDGNIDRLSKLLDLQGSTNVVGSRFGEGQVVNLRYQGVREALYQDGPMSRPVRFIVGNAGAQVRGNINTVDVMAGHQNLIQTLRFATWMPKELRRQYADDFLKAGDREKRAQVLWRLENSFFKHAGEHYGLKRHEIDGFLREAQGIKGTWRSGLSSRLYSAADAKHVIGGIDPDGYATVYNRPFLQSQLEDSVLLTDPRMLDTVLRKETNRRVLSMMAEYGSSRAQIALAAQRGADVAGFLNIGVGAMMRVWKFATLLRPAYIARIQVDSQLRNFAAMGALESASRALSPMVRYGAKAASFRWSTPNMEALEANSAERMFTKTRSGPLRELLPGDRTSPAAKARLSSSGFDESALNPAYDEGESERLARLTRGQVSLDQFLSDETGRQLARIRGTGDWTRLRGQDPNWESSYLRSVNQQIRNSPTAREMLIIHDNEKMVALINKNPAMRREWKNFEDRFHDVETWVGTIRHALDSQMPDPALQSRAWKRDLTKDDMREYFPPDRIAERPEVHGEAYRPYWTDPVAGKYTQFRNWWFKFASDAPETVMARHPLFDYSYRQRLQTMVARHDGDVIEGAQFQKYREIAVRQAGKDVANTLYDIAHTSGFASNLGLFAPFFSAWEDTMKKWGRLFYDDPSRAMKFQQALMAPNDAGIVVDEDGNRVDSTGQAWDAKGKKVDKVGDESMVMPTPFLKWAGTSELKFRKDNFNLVFQGEYPWLPGAGPLVTVPVNQATLHIFPDEANHPVLKWILPYGPEAEPIERQVMPAWWRQVGNAFGTNQDHANMAKRLWAVEQTKFELGKRDKKPTLEEIQNKTRLHFIMRAFVASSAPVSSTPNAEFQEYINEGIRIRNEYEKYEGGMDAQGRTWDIRFMDEYPDYYAMIVPLSTNNTGIQATPQADDASRSPEVRKLIAANPEWGWMFVGPANAPGFDPNIYQSQLARSVAPGSNVKFRGKTDIVEAADNIESSKGWYLYQKGMTMLDLALEDRGLHSFQQSGAEDLANAKAVFIQSLRDDNPAWGREFDVQDSGKARELLRVARDAAGKYPNVANQPHMKALTTYMQGRDLVREYLATQEFQDLDHPANEAVKVAWDAWVRSLVAGNIGFEQMYNRILERDDIGQALDMSDLEAEFAGAGINGWIS